MKRLIAAAVATMSLIVCPVFGSDIDFTGMSLDELVELRNNINTEIETRLGSDTIAAGLFEAGVDIKIGIFDFECTSSHGDVKIYASKSDYIDSYYSETTYLSLSKGEKVTVALSDGECLYLDDGTDGLLKEIKPSWAP